MGDQIVRPGVIPYHCYPQFRSPGVSGAELDAAFRECTILGNTICLSVMPLLVDDAVFQSFKRNEAVWKAFGCRIGVRRRGKSLEALAEEHENGPAEEDGTKGQLNEKKARARYIEEKFLDNIVNFDGISNQINYRRGIVNCILQIHKDDKMDWIDDLCQNIVNSQHEILDLNRAKAIISQYTSSETYQAAAYLAYYESGRLLFSGASPVVPVHHAIAVPGADGSDILSALAARLQQDVWGISQVNRTIFSELSDEEFIAFAGSSAARNFGRWAFDELQKLDTSNLDSNEIEELIGQILAQKYISEMEFEKTMGWLFAGASVASTFLPFLPFLGMIEIVVKIVRRQLVPGHKNSPLTLYVQKAQEKASMAVARRNGASRPAV